MKKSVLILTFLLASVQLLAQQDPLTSTYQFNQLPINPAYSGVNDVTSIDLHYRSQWGDVEGAPTSIFFTGSTSLFENKVGIGLALLHDETGIIKNTDFNITFGYELDVSTTTTLSFGLQTGMVSLKYDFSELTLDDQTDEDFINADDGISKLNFGAGLFLSAENYYLGFSVPKLLKVTEGIGENAGERYNRHAYLSAGFVFDQLATVKLKPYTIMRFAEGAPLSFDLGASALLSNVIWGGLFTRNFNTIGLCAYLSLENNLRVGYSGELITGNDQPSSGFSTHEITIGIDLELFENQAAVRRYY